MAENEINRDYALYKAVWLLYEFFEQEYSELGVNDPDRAADERICEELDISIGQLADLYEEYQ